MAYYRCGPTAVGSRASWAVSSPTVETKTFDRPLSGNFDRIFNAFERTNAYECVQTTAEREERQIAHGDFIVNRKSSSSLERADCALAAQTPGSEDEEFYREKILYSQARQLFPLQEDLADWINKTIEITYLTGDNFLDVLDNGVELCQLAAVIHDRAKEAIDQGVIVGPVPQIKGRCWQRAARRSFFSRDNTENFITFCRALGVHDNLLFESDDLVLHNQPRQVILCLLEVARLATKFGVEPPGLVALEREIALEERDSGHESALSGAAWQLRAPSPPGCKSLTDPAPPSPDPDETPAEADDADAASTRSGSSAGSADSDVPLKPTNELDKRVQQVTRLLERGCRCGAGKCDKLLKVKKVGEGRYNIAGRNVFIRLLKGRHMMVRVGGGWDTLEHFLSRHEPCQVRLVTPGRRAGPAPAPPPPRARHATPSPASSLSGKLSPVEIIEHAPSKSSGNSSPIEHATGVPLSNGRVSPVQHKRSFDSGTVSPDRSSIGTNGSLSGKVSPAARPDSKTTGKISPIDRPSSKMSVDRKISPITPVKTERKTQLNPKRTSTPIKPSSARSSKSALTLPLKADSVDECQQKPRMRKASAPSSSTPGTPTGRSLRTPEYRKSLPSAASNSPKKPRSMSLALPQGNKLFCGTERLNQAKKQSVSAATTPTAPPKARSQSLASTPVGENKKFAATNGYAKKTRSMSLASPVQFGPVNKSVSTVTVTGAMTQAAIEESIRLSLAASIADDDCSKKPFLHIKAKYRSPPPREVPPR